MKVPVIVVLIVVVAIATWFVFIDSSEETINNINTNPLANVISTNSVNAGAAVREEPDTATDKNIISVTASGFDPQVLTIPLGEAVSWMNKDSEAHYVAPDDHPDHQKYSGIWDDDGSGNLTDGGAFTVGFAQAGTYTYHDQLNPSFTGTIIVVE